jgi:DNA primase large subunit
MPTAVPEIERVFQRSALALAEFPARQDERLVLDVGEVVDLRHDACLGVVLRDARVERRRPFRKRRVLKRPHRARSEEHDRRAKAPAQRQVIASSM